MRQLKKLGFSYGPSLTELVVTFDGNEKSLPAEYLSFLGCDPPGDIAVGFRFVRADTNEKWEGQMVEFMKYEQGTVDSAVISPPTGQGRKLLPFAVDAGGNYVCLDLTTKPMCIVDVSYESGAISQIAGSFSEFIDILYIVDE